jgi:geranylgeranyl diphosphate synthase, type I
VNLTEAFGAYVPAIEAEMRRQLEPRNARALRHYEIMQYHLGWRDESLQPAAAPSGKRIRPMLCLLACASAGGDPQAALPAAAGLELLHNFSLIHDDIEDNSPTRRHRPTAWSLWGVPIALNAGDGMFTLSHAAFFELLARGVPEASVLAALQRFVEMTLALTEGQYMDMTFETRLDVTVEEYYAMIAGKTGALLGAAPEIGALIAGASPELALGYREYGQALGKAFQLQDDILGIWGDEKETGKSAASDILTKKKSLPVVLALNDETVGKRLRTLYAGPDFTADNVPAVLTLLEQAGARAATETAVREATARGHAALQAIAGAGSNGGSAAHAPLAELLDLLVGRKS